MSLLTIRQALEAHLDAALSIPIAYENAAYTPVAGQAYAAAYLLPAEPDNVEIGPGYTDRGVFQVSLFFPKDAGPADAMAVAEAIRTAFPFATSLPLSGGGTVDIIKTPEVSPARAEDDRFMVPVKVRFSARTGG